jgi:hypothetical protein
MVPAPTTPTRLISITVHLVFCGKLLQEAARSTKTFESNTMPTCPESRRLRGELDTKHAIPKKVAGQSLQQHCMFAAEFYDIYDRHRATGEEASHCISEPRANRGRLR